jgi:archaeal flagellin FlaB
VNKLKFKKKAEMGIGTLIIFIALLLVAAIAAGVLIQTSGSLQEKALTTGDQAKGQIATNIRVIEVSASDGSAGTLRDFTQIVKLSPGSEPIKLSEVLFTMNTFDRTTTLTMNDAQTNYEKGIDGYYTLSIETVDKEGSDSVDLDNDLDEDGSVDTLIGGLAEADLIANLSTAGEIELGSCSGTTFTKSLASNDYIGDVSATCNGTGTVTEAIITPKKLGLGVFAVEYLQEGTNHVEGNLQRGDVIKIYYEAPKNIGEDEHIRLNFIPKIGSPTLTEFITPEVISTERVYLYP